MCYESVQSGYCWTADQGHLVPRAVSLFLLDGDTSNICCEHPEILAGTRVNSQLPPPPLSPPSLPPQEREGGSKEHSGSLNKTRQSFIVTVQQRDTEMDRFLANVQEKSFKGPVCDIYKDLST